jgi:iron complex outermembrane recepter protein
VLLSPRHGNSDRWFIAHEERTIQMHDIRRQNHFLDNTKLLLVLACLALLFGTAYAQDVEKDGKKSSAATEEKKSLTAEPMTITVTARKESEPILSAPLSVTAVTESTLRNADILAVKDAAVYTPNVFINEFSERALSNPFFRGIGGSPTNPGVSTFIDGVPQLNSFSSNIELIDVGQIEFVRGPEGGLYGRNTAGGLINITSGEASETWTTRAEGSFGNYNYRNIHASVSSPLLKDRFSLNLAGGYSGRDGYTVNDLTRHDLDTRGAGFGKFQLFFKASDRLKIRWILSSEQDQDGDYALGDLDYIRQHPDHVSRDFEGYTHRTVGSSTLLLDYRGRAVDFVSITGGVWWKNHSVTDLDYQTATLMNGGFFAVRDNVDQQHQFTQEFRLGSAKDKAVNLGSALNLKWQTGIFIFSQSYEQGALNNFSSIYGFFPSQTRTSFTDLDDWGMGIYGQAEFIAWKKLHVTTGLRFDYENKDAKLGAARNLSDSFSGTFSEVSPQFSVGYQYTPSQMTYVSVARGYKAGGFNPAPTGIPAPPGTDSYGAEHTWNYELGYKSKWLRDRLETTVALFYIDWKNLQLNQQIPLSGGQYFIGNAGAANSKGIEVETRFFPFSWWELFGMVGTTHARFLGNSTAFNANLGDDQRVGGNALPYAPTFNANMGTQISWAPSRRMSLYLRTQVAVFGDFLYDASNVVGQSGYSLTSFRGGVRGKRWFAEGWIDNAFDTHYVPIAIPYAQLGVPSGYIGESGAPRTYGARAGIRF